MYFRLHSGEEHDVVNHEEDVVGNDNEPFGCDVSDGDDCVMEMMRMTATTMMRTKMITKAGAISESVDILTAPSRETRRSNQGTVAAKPTEIRNFHFNLNIIDNGLV